MKNLILITALSLGVSCANAQKIKESEVPAPVKATLAKQFPTIEKVKWEKEGANYEAEFEVKEVETSALINATGNLIETEEEILVNSLPKEVAKYVSKNLSGAKIKEASKITDAKGAITYEAEVNKADYLFDANGVFIKKMKGK
ncbi:MAG: hypothetical protein ABI315_00780 [Bacteroidia bacterium]